MSAPHNRAEQIAFVRRALALTGWSQTALAKRAGLDPSTLSHFLAEGREGHALRPATIARIAEVTGLLIEPDSGVAITMEECQELARERGEDPKALAARFAQDSLPQIFRSGDQR